MNSACLPLVGLQPPQPRTCLSGSSLAEYLQGRGPRELGHVGRERCGSGQATLKSGPSASQSSGVRLSVALNKASAKAWKEKTPSSPVSLVPRFPVPASSSSAAPHTGHGSYGSHEIGFSIDLGRRTVLAPCGSFSKCSGSVSFLSPLSKKSGHFYSAPATRSSTYFLRHQSVSPLSAVAL
jgi:hypothetical protein